MILWFCGCQDRQRRHLRLPTLSLAALSGRAVRFRGLSAVYPWCLAQCMFFIRCPAHACYMSKSSRRCRVSHFAKHFSVRRLLCSSPERCQQEGLVCLPFAGDHTLERKGQLRTSVLTSFCSTLLRPYPIIRGAWGVEVWGEGPAVNEV